MGLEITGQTVVLDCFYVLTVRISAYFLASTDTVSHCASGMQWTGATLVFVDQLLPSASACMCPVQLEPFDVSEGLASNQRH
jgi:hypothetical protein